MKVPMKIIAFNGSPRKNWNTAMLLEKALDGAASEGAETELIHLYDLNYKGCISCFACKTKDGKSYGRCAVKDELTPVLKRAGEADSIVFGSPIYFGTATGHSRSFMERLLFPYSTYTEPPGTLFSRKIHTGFIYTMNVSEEMMRERGFDRQIAITEETLTRIFKAPSETFYSFDTYQFEDYSKVFAIRFNPEKKAKRRAEVFPRDCEKAFEMGARFARARG
jgi:multimeric flavodoxin WrbA